MKKLKELDLSDADMDKLLAQAIREVGAEMLAKRNKVTKKRRKKS